MQFGLRRLGRPQRAFESEHTLGQLGPKVPNAVQIFRTAHLLDDPFAGTHYLVKIQQPLLLKVLSRLHVMVDWFKVSETNADRRRQ